MEHTIDALTQQVARKFRTFGGGYSSCYNPLAMVLKDQPPSFAAGVDVREVVEFILQKVARL